MSPKSYLFVQSKDKNRFTEYTYPLWLLRNTSLVSIFALNKWGQLVKREMEIIKLLAIFLYLI